MSRIGKFVRSAEINETNQKAMPLIHTTSLYDYRSIVESWSLKPLADRLFNEDLLYFFYGRPAYFPQAHEASALVFHFPVFLVLAPNTISSARRVFPFDSGAFFGEFYSAYFHNRMQISDFEVDLDDRHSGGTPFPTTAQKIVSSFYRTNRNYYDGSPIDSSQISRMEPEVVGFLELARSRESAAFDERRSVIEVQVSREVSLTSDNLLAVLLPSEVYESAEYRRAVSAANLDGIVHMTYRTYRSKPDYFSALATDRIGDFLQSRGYF